jgi:hypothetical protein
MNRMAALLLLTLPSTVVSAEVFDVQPADVTTRAFSVVWASDEPVQSAFVRVYADADGVSEITEDLDIDGVSAGVTEAHDQGLVKLDVTGLSPDTTYYFQTQTESASGSYSWPADPPYESVTTAATTAKSRPGGELIVNDLLSHSVFGPDGTTPATAALVLVDIPGLSAYPLSAFVGSGGFSPPQAVVDLNNVFGEDGRSVQVPANEVITVTELRGLNFCPNLENYKLQRYRRIPAHEELPVITQLEIPERCYFVDTVCDGQVNVIDAQFVFNALNTAQGACAFNPALDVVEDGTINVLDAQQVFNLLGEPVPEN